MLKVRNSQNLRHKIMMSGFNSKQFALYVGITPTYMSGITCGNHCPSPRLAKNIVDSLNSRLGTNMQIEDIFFDASVPKTTT